MIKIIEDILHNELYAREVVLVAIEHECDPLDIAFLGIPTLICQEANARIANKLNDLMERGEISTYSMICDVNGSRMNICLNIDALGRIEHIKCECGVGTIKDLNNNE